MYEPSEDHASKTAMGDGRSNTRNLKQDIKSGTVANAILMAEFSVLSEMLQKARSETEVHSGLPGLSELPKLHWTVADENDLLPGQDEPNPRPASPFSCPDPIISIPEAPRLSVAGSFEGCKGLLGDSLLEVVIPESGQTLPEEIISMQVEEEVVQQEDVEHVDALCQVSIENVRTFYDVSCILQTLVR